MSYPAELVGGILGGRYRLVRLLGQGGMGSVYEAHDARHNAPCALKLLHPEFLQEPEVLNRFLTEAQTSKTLIHPNIVRVDDYALAETGAPFIAMELLEGIPLVAYVNQRTAIPPAQAAPIIYGALQALVFAHSRRIVHRDLKPENIFLVRDARGAFVTKVLDFGIAKVMDAAGGMGSKTRTGTLLGTPGYMSPEQVRNAKAADYRSDLWSMGIIFYELLTMRQPFDAATEFARLTAVLTEEPRPIEQIAPQLSGWSAFFQRALAKDPALRFQTAEEMSQALVDVAKGRPMQPPEPPRLPSNAPSPNAGTTVPSMPVPGTGARLMPTTTHISEERPVGTPTINEARPFVEIIEAPRRRGAPYWVAFVALAIGVVVGTVLGYLLAR